MLDVEASPVKLIFDRRCKMRDLRSTLLSDDTNPQ